MEQVLDSPVAAFLRECTITGLEETEATPASDLYGMYIIWCEQANLEPLSATAFSRQVKEAGIAPRRRRQENIYPGMLPTGPIPIQYILETDKAPSPNCPLNTLGF